MSSSTIRIGNAGGYWGDDPSALKRQIEGGPIDFITMDFLAEITMSIMQKQRSRDPEMGYAGDFITMAMEVMELALKKKVKIIANAGGVNPTACAQALWKAASAKGFKPKIAVVRGDDIMDQIDSLIKKGVPFTNMETGDSITDVRDRIESANIYFGASCVVEALNFDPDIVVTGRVTDTGITLAPMIKRFGWAYDDWDKLAAGIVAGHLLECGSQSTGGNFTDWHLVESFNNIGFPIAEINSNGEFILTKHEGTGGLVSVDTVREQLFYEMGNPRAYITPDVIADFTSIKLEQVGKDRVRVYGIKGYAPTDSYKVSMAYSDGYKAVGSIMISGPDARKKAEKFADIFWNKIDVKVDAKETEYVGWNACQRSLNHKVEGNEIMLRLGARSQDPQVLRRFGKWIPSLILSGPPGVCVLGGVPKSQNVVSYWPALMPKDLVFPVVELLENGKLGDEKTVTKIATGNFTPEDSQAQVAAKSTQDLSHALKVTDSMHSLSHICLARSGDKGDMCNVGVLARSEEAYKFLEQNLTAERVKNWFQELCHKEVIRYSLPNLSGFNFLLESALGGGGTMTLRTDAQGKTFAQALLSQKMEIPKTVLDSVKGQ